MECADRHHKWLFSLPPFLSRYSKQPQNYRRCIHYATCFRLGRNGCPLDERNYKQPIIDGGIAYTSTLAIALLWRRFGRDIISLLLRLADITWANDDPSAMDTLTADSKCRVTQISLLLDDGTLLRCDDTKLYELLPFGPYTMGQTGDVALYLTHIEGPDTKVRELKEVKNDVYGDRITYVPATKIKRINLRFKRPPKSRLRRAGGGFDSLVVGATFGCAETCGFG